MGTLTPKIAVSSKFTFAQEMFLVQFLVAGTAVHGRFVIKSFVFLFGQRVAAQVLGQKTTRVAFVVCGLVGGGLFAFPSSFVGHFFFLHATRPINTCCRTRWTSGDDVAVARTLLHWPPLLKLSSNVHTRSTEIKGCLRPVKAKTTSRPTKISMILKMPCHAKTNQRYQHPPSRHPPPK